MKVTDERAGSVTKCHRSGTLNTDFYRFKAFCMFPGPKIGDVIIFCIFLSFGLKRIGIRIHKCEEKKWFRKKLFTTTERKKE
jgi:hypothetical protein